MDTPLEESNLAHIGSDADKAAREAAAACEFHWEGAGGKPGVEIWRVENQRDDNDNPVFGINRWPKNRYGEFYNGDSYIVLQTSKAEDGDALVWDIYFWIGSQSSQDEYGVAAYKANELDDLLGDAPIQHREVEGNESAEFTELFPNLRYLDGGIDSGFRKVQAGEERVKVPTRLFRVHRRDRVTRSFQVPLQARSLNHGDAFLLDDGGTVYTWFGQGCSPFEKSRVAEMAHNIASVRHGHCKVRVDVGNDVGDDEDFWQLLGGTLQDVQPASVGIAEPPKEATTSDETKMYILSDKGGAISITEVEANKKNLASGDVCLIDAGTQVYVWVGKGSSKREQQESMVVVDRQIKIMGRTRNTSVTRILEGQERRSSGFLHAL